jgi:CBS domain-containing protein
MSGREKLQKIVRDLKSGKEVDGVYAKDLRAWFGFSKKGIHVDNHIKNTLVECNLSTVPDFHLKWAWEWIKFELMHENHKFINYSGTQRTYDISQLLDEILPVVDKTSRDARVGDSLSPDDTLSHAITLMMARGLSVLPLVHNSKVTGVLSFKEIVNHIFFNKGFNFANEKLGSYASMPPIFKKDDNIHSIIPDLTNHECVIVEVKVNENMKIFCISKDDIIRVFRELSIPFVLIEEIENKLRQLLSNTYTVDEVNSILTANQKKLTSNSSLSKLTFGNYFYLLKSPELWNKLELNNVDHNIFIDSIEKIKNIRNSVVHFSPDAVDDTDINTLKLFNSMLSNILCYKK